MVDLPNIEDPTSTGILAGEADLVKGKITRIPLLAEAIAPEYLVAGKAPTVEAKLIEVDGRLTPVGRVYVLSGLPWACHVQLNGAGLPDVDRLRLLLETDLAETRE